MDVARLHDGVFEREAFGAPHHDEVNEEQRIAHNNAGQRNHANRSLATTSGNTQITVNDIIGWN
jgi:hypothetical protein